MFHRLYSFFSSAQKSDYSDFILAFLFFAEAIFFFPVDPLLIVYCAENQKKSLWYGLVATLASVAGGIVAYYLGSFLWDSVGSKLISYFSTEQQFQTACYKYKVYEHWAILIGGFTPFPYKVVTLSAGFCKLPIAPFIICSLISRGARFMIIAGLMRVFGENVRINIERYFNQLVILFTLLVIGGFLFLR